MRRLLAVVAAALVWAAALEPAEVPNKNQAKVSTKWKDVELKKAIEERFERSAIAVDHFRVEVTDGVATIRGKTDVMQHKGVATRLAKTMGAKQVKNEVEITDAARQRAAEQLLRKRSGTTAR